VVEAVPKQEPKTRGSGAMRYVWIGVPLVVLVAVFFLLFWPQIQITIAINGLHAHDPVQRRANADFLKDHDDKDLVIGMLLDAVQDDGRSFDVRMICARLLLDHFDRVGKLDQLLRTGSLSTRAAVLKTLSVKAYFMTTYAEDPSYRVRETVTEWLKVPGDVTRVYAIQMAVKLKMQERLPEIRPLLTRSGAKNVHAREERDLMIAAAGALKHFGVCDAVPEILRMAATDPDPLVRLRFMQFADEMAFRTDRPVPCEDAAPEDAMSTLARKALDDEDHRVRMGALLILARMPTWARPALPRVREILNGDATGAERRHALDVLAAVGDPQDLDGLATYFHDVDPSVRATAAALVHRFPDLRLEGCLIGLVGAETENERLFIDVLNGLRKAAKKRVGFPPAWALTAAREPGTFKGYLRELFIHGKVGEVTRDGVTAAWFEWWCGHLELTAEQTKEAVAVRTGFWEALDRRDTKAAAAALAKLSFDVPGLFTYEKAWLEKRLK